MGKRILAVMLAASMAFVTVGCGEAAPTQTPSEESVQAETKEDIQPPAEDVKPQKQAVDDFYALATAEWLASKEGEEMPYFSSDAQEVVQEQYGDLIFGKTAEDYPDDPGMAFLIGMYEQGCDEEQVADAGEQIAKLVDQVDRIKTIKQYEKLLQEDVYFLANSLLWRQLQYTDGGEYILALDTKPVLEIHKTEKEQETLREYGAKMLLTYGYSEEAANQLMESVMEMDRRLEEVASVGDSFNRSFTKDSFAKTEHKGPYFDLLEHYGYYNHDHFGQPYLTFFAKESYLSFMDELLTDANLSLLKDYLKWDLLFYFAPMRGVESANAFYEISLRMTGTAPTERNTYDSISDVSMDVVLSLGKGYVDHLAHEKNHNPEGEEELKELFTQLQGSFVEQLKGYDWAGVRVGEKLSQKIKLMELELGSYEPVCTMENAKLGDTYFESFLNGLRDAKEFQISQLDTEGGIDHVEGLLIASNAFYCRESNNIVLTNGFLELFYENRDLNFEEKLGLVGMVIAHEMAHSIDVNAVYLGVDGIYMDFFGEEQWNHVMEVTQGLCNQVTGLRTDRGNEVNGTQVTAEYMTDVLAMSACLNLLKKQESPDYDGFFRNYALQYAREVSAPVEEYLLRHSYHLLGKERTNMTVANFDEFYDTYAVNSESRWYLPAEERIRGY